MMNDIRELLNPALSQLAPYTVEGGQEAAIKLNQNESPFDLPGWLKEEIVAEFIREPWNRYPDILPYRAMQAYASFVGVSPDAVMMSNGSNEMLYTVFLATLCKGRKVLVPDPSFSLYEKLAVLLQATLVRVPMREELEFDVEAIVQRACDEEVGLIVLSTPNNPTSKSMPVDAVRHILQETKALVLVDEAYVEFSREQSILGELEQYPRLIVLRTMSKALALAGIRIGFAIANPPLLAELAKPKIPFASSRLAEITLVRVLQNYSLVEGAVSTILHERESLSRELSGIEGVHLFASDTNFLVIRVPDARLMFSRLQAAGILVRNVSGYTMMENCLRCNVGLPGENQRLAATVASVLHG